MIKGRDEAHYYDDLIKKGLCMNFDFIYELTVRCTEQRCEEDLAYYPIRAVDESLVYTDNKNYAKNKLAAIEIIEKDKRFMIMRIPFLIKETAIVWVRDVFAEMLKHGTPRVQEAVRTEWMRIISPDYDCKWFTGGEKVEQWKEEMRSIVDRL